MEELLQTTCAHFTAALGRTLDELDLSLFKLAERAPSNAQQQTLFGSLGEIRLKRADAAPRFLQHVESTLARIRSGNAGAASPAPPSTPLTLELVDSSVLEEDIALREIAGKAEVRNSRALYLLSHRMGVLAAAPAWSYDILPLGPSQFAAAIRYALRHLELDTAHRILAYRLFDRMAMAVLDHYYDLINRQLAGRRILPSLQWNPVTRRPPGTGSASTPEATEATEAAPDVPAAARPAHTEHHNEGENELFAQLYRLLRERRRHHIPAPAETAAAPASTADLQSLLGAWQRENPLPADAGRTVPSHDHARFKQQLSLRLRHAGPGGRALRLDDNDADTIELVGLLFEYIGSNLRARSGAKALLDRLYVPMLRVALGDHRFFTQRSHPARELLNTIAETGERWIDEADSDPDLTEKMQWVVDSVNADFDGDSSLFEPLLASLGRHMQLLARRAEVFERRQVEAAQGHERLEVARATARSAIARALRHGNPTAAARALLERGWTDALALSALRHGSSSDEFRRRLAVASALAHGNPTHGIDLPTRIELETGLREIGVQAEALAETIAGLVAMPVGEPVEEAVASLRPPAAGETSRGFAPARAPAEAGISKPAAPIRPAVPEPVPLTAVEKETLERLREVPFGTWFVFAQNQQGETVRRKLAWFSPLTRRCLFVNQRGARGEDRTLDQLARDIVRGQARIEVPPQSSLIDRAWKAILEVLSPKEQP